VEVPQAFEWEALEPISGLGLDLGNCARATHSLPLEALSHWPKPLRPVHRSLLIFSVTYPIVKSRLYQITKVFCKNQVKLSKLERRHMVVPVHL
jgi:hypothetical protein